MRIKSPGYPNVNLRQAADAAGRLFAKNRHNVIDREAAAKDMGYSGITGASAKMLSNLSHFGLIEKAWASRTGARMSGRVGSAAGRARYCTGRGRGMRVEPRWLDTEAAAAVRAEQRPPPVSEVFIYAFGHMVSVMRTTDKARAERLYRRLGFWPWVPFVAGVALVTPEHQIGPNRAP